MRALTRCNSNKRFKLRRAPYEEECPAQEKEKIMNNIWNTTRNWLMQVSDLQGSAYLRVSTCGPVVSMTKGNTDAKDFIAHGYGGSDG